MVQFSKVIKLLNFHLKIMTVKNGLTGQTFSFHQKKPKKRYTLVIYQMKWREKNRMKCFSKVLSESIWLCSSFNRGESVDWVCRFSCQATDLAQRRWICFSMCGTRTHERQKQKERKCALSPLKIGIDWHMQCDLSRTKPFLEPMNTKWKRVHQHNHNWIDLVALFLTSFLSLAWIYSLFFIDFRV